MSHAVLLLNGPNLNLLGTRQPELYGRESLDDVEAACQREAERLGLRLDCRQSNHEGEIIDAIHQAKGRYYGLIVNAGAYSHTSVAILDALLSIGLPVIEVHLSNIYQREEFRHGSYVSRAAKGVICGLGSQGYLLALQAMATLAASPQA